MAGGSPSYRTVVLEDDSLRSLGGFTQVPNVVLKHPNISFGAKVAYGVLLSYAWSDDFCFPAQERLAKDLNCSVRQVQRLLTELRDHSFINWKQQGLNRPNVYYLLPMSRWNPQSTEAMSDTTNLSSPDTTKTTPPEATNRSSQDATNSSHKEYSRNKTQVVNRSGNDHRDPVRDRPSARRTGGISARALQSKYHLDDGQVGRVHWLVQKQVDTLGSAERNHAYYVKRAAEAVRDGHDNLLDRLLGELKQAAGEIAVASRPAYFHAMFTEALEQTASTGATSTDQHRAAVTGLVDSFTPSKGTDPRLRLIADAERRGYSVPHHIRAADAATVNRWWGALPDAPEIP